MERALYRIRHYGPTIYLFDVTGWAEAFEGIVVRVNA